MIMQFIKTSKVARFEHNMNWLHSHNKINFGYRKSSAVEPMPLFWPNVAASANGATFKFISGHSTAATIGSLLVRFLNVQGQYCLGTSVFYSQLLRTKTNYRTFIGLRGAFVHKKAQERTRFRWYTVSLKVLFLATKELVTFDKYWGRYWFTQLYLIQRLVLNWWSSSCFSAAGCAGFRKMRIIC